MLPNGGTADVAHTLFGRLSRPEFCLIFAPRLLALPFGREM